MKVKWLGHASFLITAEDGKRIVTDPYEAGYRGIIQYGPIEETADVVTVSHEHGDHNGVSTISGNPAIIRGAGQHEVAGLRFNGIASFHDRVQGAERGPNTITCFAVDGVRVCHLGDLGHPLSAAHVAQIGAVDVLLVPVGGPVATIELPEVKEVCRQLNPRIVIPMHFRTDKCPFPIHSVDDFVAGQPNVRRPASSEVEVRRDALPAQSEIVVLDHAL